MESQQAKTWMSPNPTDCEICRVSLGEEFIDGATRLGQWAIMCVTCFRFASPARGKLGKGLGQRYKFNPKDGKFYCVEGGEV